jgi:hypothetical protein
MKHQFCIRFSDIDVNSSASKAVLDCNAIFSAHGYKDYTLTVPNNANKKYYYYLLFKEIVNFLFSVKKGDLVGIQYPLLSINNVFKYFIQAARLKKVRFFCIIHDLESLRTGGIDKRTINIEKDNLNYYDLLIVHNQSMMKWLHSVGVSVPMIPLTIFDYLSDQPLQTGNDPSIIVYAGNLAKSTFIYALPKLESKKFIVYGPGCSKENLANGVEWGGVYSPEEIVGKMRGGFGLIWDGSEVDRCDSVLGNYLYYNNPHKASLYLAAGLPLIAPWGSAIGKLILEWNIGIVVKSLLELQYMEVSKSQYERYKKNVNDIRKKIVEGYFFSEAIANAEETLDFEE